MDGKGLVAELVLTLTRLGREFPSSAVSVKYFTENHTAVEGSDYEGVRAGTEIVMFDDGQVNATLTITVLDDGCERACHAIPGVSDQARTFQHLRAPRRGVPRGTDRCAVPRERRQRRHR